MSCHRGMMRLRSSCASFGDTLTQLPSKKSLIAPLKPTKSKILRVTVRQSVQKPKNYPQKSHKCSSSPAAKAPCASFGEALLYQNSKIPQVPEISVKFQALSYNTESARILSHSMRFRNKTTQNVAQKLRSHANSLYPCRGFRYFRARCSP